MVHLQAPDYTVPWADEEFIEEFGPIEGRKCYQLMHKRESPCEICPTFEAFETEKTVVSEWDCDNGHTYLTIVKRLPHNLPLLIEFAFEMKGILEVLPESVKDHF